MRSWSIPLLAASLLAGCGGRGAAPERPPAKDEAPSKPAADAGADEKAAPAATPVRVATVTRADLVRVVVGPGRTAAILQQKVRAPFSGTLTELKVTDGDQVRAGDVVGTFVSRESGAALQGAREMEREAKTPPEKADAERAVTLAEKGLVKAPLRVAADGIVQSHAAAAGDRVSEDQEILTISTTESVVFQADIAQGDLPSVRKGQRADVSLAGWAQPLPGLVHDVLASGNPGDLTVPVRIDLRPLPPRLPLGLFGTARIVVGERPRALVAPPAAVIRDDITGVSRIATLNAEGHVHWVEVQPGLADSEHVEIKSPPLPEGSRVIVSGQVGLPEDAPVRPEP